MQRNSINHQLDQLDELKSRFGSREYRTVERILRRLSRQKISDVESLIRFHEILLFLSAYAHSARIRQLTESQLRSFGKRVAALREAEVDLSALDDPEVSGIAGTAVVDTFTFHIVRWLLTRHPAQVKLDWDWFDDSNRLAETWPRFMPLLDEDAFVEANVPYQDWLRAATGRGGRDKELPWLFQRFAALPKSDREKAELYNSQNLFVSWTPEFRATRTGMRLPVRARNIFYHRGPLIQRREVSLRDELDKPAPVLKHLPPKQGETILHMARETSTLRYRELYGFTHGEPRRVLQANIGRGVDIFVMGVPPDKRLPLRAYHAAMIFKNGVPVGYFEGLSLFERMESGFNLYYTFRDGETAWLYAHTLHIFRHLLGVTVFTLDPYQIGHENEEGIESGAFWFYRKFGFRPASPEVMKLVLNEEKKIASRSGYRTPAGTLRRLAESPMIFELQGAPGGSTPGDWDRFQVRNLGRAVQRRMAAKHGGEAEKFKSAAVKNLARSIGMRADEWPRPGLPALHDFAVVLSLVEDLHKWTAAEKRALVKVIRAKAGLDESGYLKSMQKHARLRRAIIKLGS
ncbi:MAG: hypothetical protein ACREA9_20055 [Pyrinomonadaceae bacterium]